MTILLKNGRILDPSQNLDEHGSLLIEDDQIVEFGDLSDDIEADEVYDCTDMWIAPGLVDLHTHLREPGDAHKETIVTGTQAAAAGGYTTICCMPNTRPALDNPALVDFILDKSASPESGGVFVAPVGALTLNLEGKKLADLAAMKRAGIVAASDEGFPTQDAEMMHMAMEFCLQLDLPILAHCDDTGLSRGGCMNEGAVSAMLGLNGIPRVAEDVAVMRNCLLALHTGCQLHVMRVSTWGAVEMIRQAKYLGAPVTCEICPMHFTFSEDAVGEFDTNFKIHPPLRTKLDQELLFEALTDGTIDCIASDHSPHATYEVDVPFDEAPFGVSSLEITAAATLTNLTHPGVLTPLQTVDKLSTAPAKILRLDAGSLAPGRTPVAQITVIDPNLEWTFDKNQSFSKSRNTPFHKMKFKGKPMLTFCGGEIYRDHRFDSERYKLLV